MAKHFSGDSCKESDENKRLLSNISNRKKKKVLLYCIWSQIIIEIGAKTVKIVYCLVLRKVGRKFSAASSSSSSSAAHKWALNNWNTFLFRWETTILYEFNKYLLQYRIWKKIIIIPKTGWVLIKLKTRISKKKKGKKRVQQFYNVNDRPKTNGRT